MRGAGGAALGSPFNTGPLSSGVDVDPATREARANYHFLTSAVAPRPIAWVTTIDPATGVVNLAPFSWFNAVCADPAMLMLAIQDHPDGSPKDTVRNIRATGEYVVNVVPKGLGDAMVQTSGDYPPDVSEAEVLGLATAPSRKVRPPRLAASPVHLECRLVQELRFGRAQKVNVVLGEVVHIAADDAVLDARGNLDPDRLALLGRMGGSTYVDTARHFPIQRPARQGDAVRTGER